METSSELSCKHEKHIINHSLNFIWWEGGIVFLSFFFFFQQMPERRGYGICECHLMKWPRAYFTILVSCPPASPLLNSTVCAPLPSPWYHGCIWQGDEEVLNESEFLEDLPPCPMRRFPCLCFKNSLSLIANSS